MPWPSVVCQRLQRQEAGVAIKKFSRCHSHRTSKYGDATLLSTEAAKREVRFGNVCL
jgi:hypothetical protein